MVTLLLGTLFKRRHKVSPTKQGPFSDNAPVAEPGLVFVPLAHPLECLRLAHVGPMPSDCIHMALMSSSRRAHSSPPAKTKTHRRPGKPRGPEASAIAVVGWLVGWLAGCLAGWLVVVVVGCGSGWLLSLSLSLSLSVSVLWLLLLLLRLVLVLVALQSSRTSVLQPG